MKISTIVNKVDTEIKFIAEAFAKEDQAADKDILGQAFSIEPLNVYALDDSGDTVKALYVRFDNEDNMIVEGEGYIFSDESLDKKIQELESELEDIPVEYHFIDNKTGKPVFVLSENSKLSRYLVKNELKKHNLKHYHGQTKNYALLALIIAGLDVEINWPEHDYGSNLKMLINGEERYYSTYTGIETMIMDLYLDPEIGQYLPESTKTMCKKVLEKIEPVELEVFRMLHDDNVSLDDLWSRVSEGDIGNYDGLSNREIIIEYISEKMREDIKVSHMLVALEEHDDTDYFKIWLGNSMETPKPIRTKRELLDAIL